MLPKILLACLMATSATAASDRADDGQLRVQLVSEQATLAPGAVAWLGVLIEHAPHWHSYWKHPGDAGLATRLRWTLPEGAVAGEVNWPAPRAFDLSGIVSYGYEGRVLLPVPLTLAASYAAAGLPLELRVDWLACREECIPGRADLRLELPVATQSRVDARHRADFADARARLPQAVTWPAEVRLSAHGARVEIQAPGDLPAALALFPADGGVLAHAVALAPARREQGRIVIDARPSDQPMAASTIELTLVGGDRAWQLPARVLPAP